MAAATSDSLGCAIQVSPLSGFSEAREDGGDALDHAVPLPDDAVAIEDEDVGLQHQTPRFNKDTEKKRRQRQAGQTRI